MLHPPFRLLSIAALVLLLPLPAGAADGPGLVQTENPLRIGPIPNQLLTEGMPALRIPVEVVAPAGGQLRIGVSVTGNQSVVRATAESGGGRWYVSLRSSERVQTLPARASVTVTAWAGVLSNAVSFSVTIQDRGFLPNYRVQGAPQWGPLTPPSVDSSVEVLWVDVNRDGLPDAVAPGAKGIVLSPRPPASSRRISYGSSPSPGYAGSRWTDLNGDGLVDSCAWTGRVLDVLITRVAPNLTTFVRRPQSLPVLTVAGAEFVDLDGDGTQDLVYTGTVDGTPRVVTALNDGNGDFGSVSNALPAVAGPVVAADFNRDGRWDLLLTESDRPGTPAQVFYNQGGLVFVPGPQVSGLDPVTSAGTVDVNGDGRPDVWLVQALRGNPLVPELRVWVQEGGRFAEVLHLPAGEFRAMGSPGWGDFDHDGRMDLVAPWSMPMPNLNGTAGSTNVVMLYRNTGGANLEPSRFLFLHSTFLAPPGRGPNSFVPSPADLDQDGDLDLMGYEQSYRPFYNQQSSPNLPPDVPEGFRGMVVGNDLFLFWSGARDRNQETPTSINVRVGTRPGANDVVPSNSLADGTRMLTAVGNAGFASFYTMKIPRRDLEQLYCTVQAVDASFAGGPFAPEVRIPIETIGNQPPVIEAPSEIRMNEDETVTVRFTVIDDRTRASDLEVAVRAEGTGPLMAQQLPLTPFEGVGDGLRREFTLRPVPDQYGQDRIHIIARDRNRAATTNVIPVFVQPVNDPPTVQVTIPGLHAVGGVAEGTLALSDVESPVERLRVTVESSNPDLLPPSGVTITGEGLFRSVVARPVDSREGPVTLTFRVTDPDGTESRGVASLVWLRQVLEPDPDFNWAAELLDATWVDFNRDGALDVVGHRASGTVEVWTQQTDGSFVRSSEDSLGQGIDAIQIGDLDGDGAPDLLVAGHWPRRSNGRLHVLWNDNGTASKWTTLSPGPALTGEALLDVDGDGDLDVVAGHDGGELRMLRNAPGAFRSVTVPAWEPLVLGNPDLLQSDGNFQPRLQAADLNQDGRMDLMVSRIAGPVSTVHRALLLSETGRFEVVQPQWAGRWGGPWTWLGSADFDNDGRDTFLLRNDAEGVPLPIHVADSLWVTGGIPMTVASPPLGDIDGDGYTDVLGIVRNPPGVFGLVSRVGGNPVFHPQRPIDASLDSMSAGDVNRDGTLELWVRTTVGSQLLRNRGAVSNRPPSTPSGLRLRQVEPGVLEISWEPSVDAEQSGGLTYNVRVGTASGADDIVSALALSDGRGLVPAVGNTGGRTVFRIRGAELARTYYATVQAVDAGFARSPFAAEVSFTVDALPTLSGLANFSLPRGAGPQMTSFTVGDLETPADQLQVSVESSNPVLLPMSRMHLTGSGTGRVLEFQTQPKWAGVATIRIRVTDGSGNTVERTFEVFVPTATPYAVELERVIEVPDNAGTDLRLDDFDPDGDFLEYLITVEPSHGRLEGTGPEVVFHPDPGFTGQDSFRFLAMTPGSFPASGRVVLNVVPGHRLRPVVEVDPGAGGLVPRLRVRGRSGSTVRLEYSTDLRRWETGPDWMIPGNEMLDVAPEVPGDAAARFYRVVTEP